MKRALKYIAITLASLFVLLLALPLCIYIPAVQRWGKTEICRYVNQSTGMQLTIGDLSLRFPFKLQIDDILLLTAPGDTLLQSGNVQVGIAPARLLKGEVDVTEIALHATRFRFANADSTLTFSARVERFATQEARVDLKGSLIELPSLQLQGGDIALDIAGESTDTTDTASAPLDWRISVGEIGLSQIHYAMQMQPTIQQLDASIETATLRKGYIDLYRQQVDVAEATIDRGDYRYYPGSGETGETTTPSEEAADTVVSPPWTVRIAQLRLHQNSALYALPTKIPQKGLDPGYLSLNGIEIAIDSLYNQGSAIRVPIKQLAFVERSGLAVTHTQGVFAMDSTGIALHDFLLQTALSEISAQLQAGSDIFTQSPQAPVEAELQARIAVGDLIRLFPQYDSYTRGVLLSNTLHTDITVGGTLGDLRLTRGDLSLPGTFNARTTGRVQHLPDTERLAGELQWGIALRESPLIAQFIPDSLRHRLHLPPTRFSGRATLAGPTIQSRARLSTGDGSIALRARLDTRSQQYRGRLHIDRFPLSAFLPHDSLGVLSASARIEGERYNPLDSLARLTAHLEVDTAQYAGYLYSGLTVDARVNRGRATGHIACTDPNLLVGLSLSGSISPQQYLVALSGDIHTDLEALRLTTETCQMSTSIALSGQVEPEKEQYQATLDLSKLSLLLPTGRLQTDKLSLAAQTDSTRIQASLQSGDLAVNFTSATGLTPFLAKLSDAMPIVASVQEKKRLDMEALHQALPPFELTASAKRNNLVQQYLQGAGMGFSQFSLTAANDSLLNARSQIDRFSASGIVIDTIQLSLFERHEREERLYYSLQVGNKPGNLDQLASVNLNGFLSGNTTKFFCVQKNRQGQEGFRIGSQVDFLDSLVKVSLFPKNPIIGFETWTLNPDNFLAYHYDRHHFDANIALTHGDRHLIVTTLHGSPADHDLARQEPLKVDINGMEIAPWLALSPFSPQIAGSVSANLLVDFPQSGTQVAGNLEVSQFYYGKRRVGDFDLKVDYLLDSLGRQEAQAALQIDSVQVLTLSGELDDKAESPVTLQLSVDSLPLATANPFLPADMAQLQGYLNGQMTVGGTTSAPQLDGYLQIEQASASSKSMGASLNFSPNPIRIDRNVLLFDNYEIAGANKNPLHIDGNVDFRNLEKINTDLHIFASAFQPVKSGRSTKATLYGSVIADMDMRVNGPLDGLKITGNVGLLTGTEVTYVMQDSPFALQQQENNIVTFVSFNDSTEVIEADTLPKSNMMGMDILVNINISPTVKMGVNLSVDGKNRIDLQGGGNLTYTMNTLGDSRFSGRYNLSGGFVRYNPPIISEKLFKIQDGSFVSWNGDIADPQMSITAVETVRTTITEDDKNSRQVNFDISILIKNSLENLSVSFDLSAPEDLTLQNQLTSLTAEQRASQAMSLLIYNTYTGPGTSTTRSDLLGNPLNSFLEKELNQWAQGLKGIDLSFGIDSYTDASGINTRTDYSYRAAKSLFNNRVKVVIGGSLSPDDNADVNFKENFIDDISLEYYLNQRDNMYIKVFRHTGYESILEGEITQTGVGFVVKKRLVNLWELFRSRKSRKEAAP